MKYYLDANIISYTIKGKYPKIIEHLREIPSQSIVIPTIEYSAQKSVDYDKTIKKYNQFTSIFNKAIFSEKASIVYGKIRSDLEKSGNLIGPNDLIIAATVIAENGILVTNNVKEFQKIENLKIENWTK